MPGRRESGRSFGFAFASCGAVYSRWWETFLLTFSVQANCFRVFRWLPQTRLVVHSFRTAGAGIFVDENFRIGESAITAGVNDTPPVIAQVGSAAVIWRARWASRKVCAWRC